MMVGKNNVLMTGGRPIVFIRTWNLIEAMEGFTMVDNKVVLITGAASGIGYEISRDFGKEGAKIVLSDINEVAVKKAAKTLQS